MGGRVIIRDFGMGVQGSDGGWGDWRVICDKIRLMPAVSCALSSACGVLHFRKSSVIVTKCAVVC